MNRIDTSVESDKLQCSKGHFYNPNVYNDCPYCLREEKQPHIERQPCIYGPPIPEKNASFFSKIIIKLFKIKDE